MPEESESQIERLEQEIASLRCELEALQKLAGKSRDEFFEAAERWQFALVGSREGVWDWYPQDNSGNWNDQWWRMLGYVPGERPLSSIDDFEWFVHPDDFEDAWSAQLAHLEGKTDFYEAEFRMRCKDGSWKWILSRGMVVVRDAGGKPLRFVGTHTDIDDKHQNVLEIQSLNQELLDRTRKLEISNQELEAFSYSVSHDLRAPIRAIDGDAAAILDDHGADLPQDVIEELNNIRKNANRMGELITDLLKLSRISRTPLDIIHFDLCSLGAEVAAEIIAHYPNRKIEFVGSNEVWVHADRALMRIVLVNIYDNAVKFTSRKPTTRIECGTKDEHGTTVFYVKDNGIGFSQQEANSIFEPFQRLHSQRDYSGHGIGLATVRRIISMHGGKVWAEGTPDEGATFFFTLGADAYELDSNELKSANVRP